MSLDQSVNDLVVKLINFERRLDPYFRDEFDWIFKKPLENLAQGLLNLKRKNEHLALGEERMLVNEAEITNQIIETMSGFLREQYPHGGAQRAGNTKTYGVVRGEFEVINGLSEELSQGICHNPGKFPAWVRFAGPGPLSPPDLEDNGIMSIGIKLMGVEGEKLLADEKWTQDFTGISSPTFTTPNIVENLKLQKHLLGGTPSLYFLNPFDSHYLDLIMQGLYSRTNTSPLEVGYYSCVPYLWGENRAIHYLIKPRSNKKSKIPKKPSDNYLREAMVRTLSQEAVDFDFMIQFQTDSFKMPIEDASVKWPEKLSPFIPVGRLHLPVQKFDSEAQLNFAGNLSYNPWHCIAEHRPLGNQNRARKTIYLELSKFRQNINNEARIEPTGNESFEN